MQGLSALPAVLTRSRPRLLSGAAVIVLIISLAGWWVVSRPRWRPFGPPGGTYLTVSPAFATDNTLFARAQSNGFFRSADAGATWSHLPGLDPTYVVFSPAYAADHTLAVGSMTPSGTPLALSTDGGVSWAPIPLPPGHAAVIGVGLHGAPHMTIFVSDYVVVTDANGTRDAVPALYRSLDRGQSWEELPLPAGILAAPDIVLSPTYATDRTVFLDDGPLYRSADGGLTWARVEADAQGDVVFSPDFARDRTMFALGADRVWRSVDAGQTWAGLEPDVWGCTTNFELAASFPASGIAAIATSAQYRGKETAVLSWSADGGASWREETMPQFPQAMLDGPGACLKALALAPGFPQDPRIVMATDHELFLSRDGGASWEDYGQSIHFSDFYLPAYFSHGGRVFAQAFGEIYAIDLPR